MKRVFYFISWITIFSAMGLILLFGFWMLYPYKTLVIDSIPEVTDKKQYKAGDTMVFTVNYCKFTDVKPLVTRQFVDGIVYTIPTYISATNTVGCGSLKVMVDIPKSLPVGRYRLVTKHLYQVNPLRTITVEATTERFDIVK